MKNLFLLLIMVTFFGTISGQTTKGTWIVGLHNYTPIPLTADVLPLNYFPQTSALGISFGSSQDKYDGVLDDDKVNSSVFGLSLNSHYFVADQFAIGLVGNLSSGTTTYKYDNDSDEKYSATIFLMGPELRYYFDAGGMTKIWLKGGASFGSISSKDEGESNDPYSLSQFGGGAGISIFPMSTVSIDIGLAYNVLTVTQNDEFGDYQSINSGLTFDVGFGIFFGGDKKTPAPITE
jgi:hypothetical protein